MIRSERIGILSLYAAEGYIDSYKYILIESLTKYFGKFVITVNGCISGEAEKRLSSYTDEIYIRPNIGYDIGAYRDTALEYLGKENWQDWEELVLLNDTFYGPMFAWDSIFEIMEVRDNDFWGLGEHIGGTDIEPHIQSYFMAFRQNILRSPFFWNFWKSLPYPKDREEAINHFELIFTGRLKSQGFREDSYMRAFPSKFTLKYGQCAYLEEAYSLLREIRFPVVKCRLFSPVYYEQAEKVLAYIRDTGLYDLNLIYEHLERLEENGDVRPFGVRQLEKFYHTHRKTYIFGYGQFGKNVGKFFHKNNWEIAAFVTTKGIRQEGVLSLAQLKLAQDDGIVLALGDRNLREVYASVSRRFKAGQMLMGKLKMDYTERL